MNLSRLVFIVLILCSGCRLQIPQTRRDGVEKGPMSLERIQAHVLFLDADGQEGRRVATRGFSRTAVYLSERLREFGVQGVFTGEHRMQYASAIEVLIEARVSRIGQDTLILIQGQDFLVDASSGDGNVTFSRVDLLTDGGFLMITGEVEILVGSLSQDGVRERRDYPVVRISRAVWEEPHDPDERWTINITKEEQIVTAAMNVAGYIAGADPGWRDSLIVIVAPVDGDGLQGSHSLTDGSDSSVAAAALLEMTRRITVLQSQWSVFRPSFLIAFVSGTRRACDGPRALMRNIPWSKGNISSIHVLTAAGGTQCNWAKLTAEAGIAAPTTVRSIPRPRLESEESDFGAWHLRQQLLTGDYPETASAEALLVATELLDTLLGSRRAQEVNR